MDGSNIDHSDSDSTESWTLLETSPVTDDVPEFSGNQTIEGLAAENTDKDDDTDGISIISDSDPESPSPCEISYDQSLLNEEICPTEQQTPQYISVNPLHSSNNDDYHKSARSEDDFLGDNNGKLKTYVHRRNKRLSTVLNIIVLGSVITAAGMAIGHMWGVKDDCTMHTTPSVNKILSNLYKLQEENSYLRSKLKELTLLNNIQMQQRKSELEKIPHKQQRCKKVFEESLNNKNVNRYTKCVDNENTPTHMVKTEYENESLNGLEKSKISYTESKKWTNEGFDKNLKPGKLISEKIQLKVDENLNKQIKSSVNTEQSTVLTSEPIINIATDDIKENLPEKRITYADSLKFGKGKKNRRDNIENPQSKAKQKMRKNKSDDYFDAIAENKTSDEEFKKDDRSVACKHKHEKTKKDRQKSHKKQKRKNKYQQWEMKGGYLKDYDAISMTSSHAEELIKPNLDVNHIDQISETDVNVKPGENDAEQKPPVESKPVNGKINKESWYEMRAALRKEARKQLEHELFGENTPNSARWYFRRMQKREQCRTKGDNTTYRKFNLRNMNYKMKH